MADKISRDPLKQNKYKDELKKESVNLYGSEVCWASKKPYKGLIASHIKPYKICVLEGDVASQFSVDNGLLLSKAIDDYFDKLLLTFDEKGKMIFSDEIPDLIKEEFSAYSLDEKVYNDARKQYMKIHRSLFFYKNYCQADPNYATDRLDNIEIPYFDCGIRIYNEKVIVEKDGGWRLCPIRNLKTVFAERTQDQYKIKTYMSSSDLYSKIVQTKEYLLDEIPQGFYTPDQTVDLEKHSVKTSDSKFKLCKTGFDLQSGRPQDFIALLMEVFQDAQKVEAFRKLIAIAALGKGYSYGIALKGDLESISGIMDIIKGVFGAYAYEYANSRAIVKDEPVDETLPNCRILILKPKKAFEKNVLNKLIDNTFFEKTVLNIDKYVPIVVTANKAPLDRFITIEVGKHIKRHNIEDIINDEGGKILNWFVEAISPGIEKEEGFVTQSNMEFSQEAMLKKWLEDKCIITQRQEDQLSPTALYEEYRKYMNEQQYNELTMKKFCMEMSQYLPKRRSGAGMLYIGIKLKKS